MKPQEDRTLSALTKQPLRLPRLGGLRSRGEKSPVIRRRKPHPTMSGTGWWRWQS